MITLMIIIITNTAAGIDSNNYYNLSIAVCNLFNEGVHIVVGTTLPSTYNTIQSYSHALHVPFILASSTRQGSRDHYQYDVSLSPPFVDAVIRTIAGIPRNHKVYYVYDNDDGKLALNALVALISNLT